MGASYFFFVSQHDFDSKVFKLEVYFMPVPHIVR